MGVLSPAFAQQAASEADDSGAIEEVIVTATRRAENILKVPYNITAVSGEEIDDSIMLDTAELLRGIPGVSMVDRGPRNQTVLNGIRIRGLNVDSSALGDFAVSSVATVATYVNETPVFANFLLKDIDRVEVLRGPQATLYGSGALGGAVKYHLRAPELDSFEGRVSATGTSVRGSNSLGYAADLILNIPLGDKAALRTTIARVDYPGITDYVNLYVLDDNGVPVAPDGIFSPNASFRTQKDADAYDALFARVSLLWKPTTSLDITFNYFHQDEDVGGRRQQSIGTDGFGRPYRDFENGAVLAEPSDAAIDLVSMEVNLDLGFATLTSATSYYDQHGSSISDNTGFFARAGFLFFYYNYPRPAVAAARTFSDESFIQEVRLVSNTEGLFDYVVGLFYQNQTRLATQNSRVIGFPQFAEAAGLFLTVLGDEQFVFRRHEDFEDFAVFGELTWHISDRVRFTGGFRYFTNDLVNDTSLALPVFELFAVADEKTFKVKDHDVLLKGNLAIDLAENNLLYVVVSEGYRRGGANSFPTEGPLREPAEFLPYASDTVTNFEIGVKGIASRISDTLRYDLSLFRINWKNPQLNTSTPIHAFFTVINGDKARTQGVELQLNGNFTEQLGFAFGYAFVDAKVTRDFLLPIDQATADALFVNRLVAPAGSRLAGIPKHMINVALDYRRPLSPNFDLITRIDGFYQSKTHNTITTDPRFAAILDGFQIWDLTMTLAARDWGISFFIKNVFDSRGITGVFKEEAFGAAPAVGFFGNTSRQLISLPRTFGLAARYNF